MRLLKLAALLAALMLFVGACGNNGEDVDQEADDDDEDVTAVENDRGGDLDDDVAAVVNGEEIPASMVQEQVETFSANPDIAEALEGDDAELTMAVMQAQILTTLIINVVALEAAEELGVPVTDEDVERIRAELEDETGGPDELQDVMERDGMSERQLANQLEARAAMRNIQEALAEDADADEDATAEPEATQDPEMTEDPAAGDPDAPEDDAAPRDTERADPTAADPDELRAQQHIAERLLAADVVVNDDYGEWDSERGQVVPTGLPEASPTPRQDPEARTES
ncbi:MAG TPA: SurA N-terminal domain-containing protein [Egibacteraceae bacterium]|nr:SurA N-terminal domain-containing protein [Egibacteraceae bacterium]